MLTRMTRPTALVLMALFFLFALFMVRPLHAADAQDLNQHSDGYYIKLDPPRATDDPNKIEVLEFFSYTCPHCYDFHTTLAKWAAALPSDVKFRRIALPGSAAWTNTAKMFYALQATGDLDKLDTAVFDGIHRDGQRFFIDEKNMAVWVKEKGGDAEKFTAAYNSFGVNSHLQAARQLSQNYNIDGVPVLSVDGRYLVPVHESFDKTIDTLNQLIDRVRKEKKN